MRSYAHKSDHGKISQIEKERKKKKRENKNGGEGKKGRREWKARYTCLSVYVYVLYVYSIYMYVFAPGVFMRGILPAHPPTKPATKNFVDN